MKIVFYTDVKYEYQAKALIESILATGENIEMIYYNIGFNSSLEYPKLTKKFFEIDSKKPKFEFYKPSILLDAIDSFGDGNFLFLDSDIIVGRRFSISKVKTDFDFPMCSVGNWDFPFKSSSDSHYIDGVFVGDNTCDERNLMKQLDVKARSMMYIYTCLISFNDKCRDIINEWKLLCDDDYLMKNHEFFFPFPDETALNVTLWKRNVNKNFGRIYLNTLEAEPLKYIEENDNITGDPNLNYGILGSNLMRCDNSSDIMFYHGIKDAKILDDVIEYLKKDKVNMTSSEETKQKYISAINNTKVSINKPTPSVSFNLHFVGNPFLEILGNTNDNYNVKFYDDDKIIHTANLKCNMWTKLNRKYFTNWEVKVDNSKGVQVYNEKINLKNRRVYIAIDSKSLGDTLAWMPYLEEFRKKHDCKLIASTFWNKFFQKSYKGIEFVNPGMVVNSLYAMYAIGWFYNNDSEPILPSTIPLQKTATNILGLDYTEIKPRMDFNFAPGVKQYTTKYVTIAPSSTAGLKFWNNKTGWSEVIKFLKSEGYDIINVSKEKHDLEGVHNLSDLSIENTMNVIYHSDFFIGLSSGLSWLSWAIGKHVVMISNFTEYDHEFTQNCTRITDKSVCHGCWNNPNFKFDKGDWNWCPVNKGTNRQFECHTNITGETVINKIKNLISQSIPNIPSIPNVQTYEYRKITNPNE